MIYLYVILDNIGNNGKLYGFNKERQEQGMYSLEEVRATDPQIAQAIEAEQKRQNSHIELIASENWVSKAVMAAMGSPLTNSTQRDIPVRDIMVAVNV